MGGRITVESVVRCSWNGWPDDRGIRTERRATLGFSHFSSRFSIAKLTEGSGKEKTLSITPLKDLKPA